jgi:hypothetical protein
MIKQANKASGSAAKMCSDLRFWNPRSDPKR